MTSEEIVQKVEQLFRERGGSQYGGEAVSQQEHALQAAYFAEQDGASTATIVSALLHDVGHLLHDLNDDAPEQGIDDVHEELAEEWLKDYFPAEVTEPVRLHVAAKRYLCTVEPAYLEILSEPSIVSLKLQGGLLSKAEVRFLEQHEYFAQIVQVRRYDDRAKLADFQTPDLEHYLPLVAECFRCQSEAESVP